MRISAAGDSARELDVRLSYGSTILLRIAYRTSSADERKLSLRMIAARWLSTVLRLILRSRAISLFGCPSATNCTTARSRSVRVEAEWRVLVRNDFNNTSETPEVKNGLWVVRASMAAIR